MEKIDSYKEFRSRNINRGILYRELQKTKWYSAIKSLYPDVRLHTHHDSKGETSLNITSSNGPSVQLYKNGKITSTTFCVQLANVPYKELETIEDWADQLKKAFYYLIFSDVPKYVKLEYIFRIGDWLEKTKSKGRDLLIDAKRPFYIHGYKDWDCDSKMCVFSMLYFSGSPELLVDWLEEHTRDIKCLIPGEIETKMEELMGKDRLDALKAGLDLNLF